MRTHIITIGNSKGVRIPKALLEASGLNGDVELQAIEGEITITAAPPELEAQNAISQEMTLSAQALHDWQSDEEAAAWAHLQ